MDRSDSPVLLLMTQRQQSPAAAAAAKWSKKSLLQRKLWKENDLSRVAMQVFSIYTVDRK